MNYCSKTRADLRDFWRSLLTDRRKGVKISWPRARTAVDLSSSWST